MLSCPRLHSPRMPHAVEQSGAAAPRGVRRPAAHSSEEIFPVRAGHSSEPATRHPESPAIGRRIFYESREKATLAQGRSSRSSMAAPAATCSARAPQSGRKPGRLRTRWHIAGNRQQEAKCPHDLSLAAELSGATAEKWDGHPVCPPAAPSTCPATSWLAAKEAGL